MENLEPLERVAAILNCGGEVTVNLPYDNRSKLMPLKLDFTLRNLLVHIGSALPGSSAPSPVSV